MRPLRCTKFCYELFPVTGQLDTYFALFSDAYSLNVMPSLRSIPLRARMIVDLRDEMPSSTHIADLVRTVMYET